MARDFKTGPTINGHAIVPTGGGLGAIPAKLSTTDYDVGWSTAPVNDGALYFSSTFGWVPAARAIASVAVLNSAAGSSNGALTASSTQEIMLSTGQRFHMDTSRGYAWFRIVANLSTGNANATLALQFASNTSMTSPLFALSGTGTADGTEKLAIATTAVPLDSGWLALAAGARSNSYWRLVTISGAATTAPVWKNVYVNFM